MELSYDIAANTLRLTLPVAGELAGAAFVESIDGILDIGEGGRLIGIEFEMDQRRLHLWLIDPIAGAYTTLDTGNRAYIQLSPDNLDGDVRSAALQMSAVFNANHEMTGLVIPRRGHGYEITYPSGNQ